MLNVTETLQETILALPESSPMRQRWLQRFNEERTEPQPTLLESNDQCCAGSEMQVMKQRLDALEARMPSYSFPAMLDFALHSRDQEIADLKDQNSLIIRALGKYAIGECGELPDKALLTYLKCQVWHSPHLTKDEQKIKSIWSFRLSIEVAHHRLPEEINVRLFPLKQFYHTARKPNMRTQPIVDACENLLDHGMEDEAWAGFIQGFTRKKGRPYVKEQAGFIFNHMKDTSPMATQAQVMFSLSGKLHEFSPMRPANGDAGSSLWWCEWRQSEAAT
jgi:hypothetical protein